MTIFEQSLEKAHAFLNHDFCPGANRWVYWMKHPLASLGAAGVVAGFCGIFVNPAAFALLAAILVVGIVGAFWPWIAVRGLSAEAEFIQTRCRVGQAVIVRLRIANRLPWPAWGLSIRRGFHLSLDESDGLALARVRGWSETEFEWVFTPQARGVFPMESPHVDTAFPFGLWYAYVPIQMQNELVVWPHSVSLDAMPDAAEIQTREDQLTDRRTGHCGDFVGIRPFREGDALRRVHWLQTARTGRLIVIERQAPATCAIRLVIDVDQSRHLFANDQNSLEHALSLSASVLESLHRQHAFVELQVHDKVVPIGESKSDLRRGLDLLARVPVDGIRCNHSCHFDHPTRGLPTIAVTTDRAFAHHLGHKHVNFGERYVIIRTNELKESPSARTGCDCHAWIEVAANETLAEVLPSRWRRACHAA